jgi:hypothetical protein
MHKNVNLISVIGCINISASSFKNIVYGVGISGATAMDC